MHDRKLINKSPYLAKHRGLFEQLSGTLTDRPITFAKFSFRKAEVEDDQQMRPIMQGIYEETNQGAMTSSEFWSIKQQRQFLKQSQMQSSKMILKRFSHWEWDANSNKQRLMELALKLKQNIYTSKDEMKTKKQLEAKNGEQVFRKRLIKQWSKPVSPSLKERI